MSAAAVSPLRGTVGDERSSPAEGRGLNAAITSALVGIAPYFAITPDGPAGAGAQSEVLIQTEYLGRGPTSASTFHHGHVLVTLMHEVLTPAEKSLTRTNRTDAVDHIRHLFQETMEADFREAVERLTGRKVLAFISDNHIEPDIAPSCSSSTRRFAGRARSHPGCVD